MFSRFNKNSTKKIAARENKASVAEVAAAMSALQKLLVELPSSQVERLTKDSSNSFQNTEEISPRVEQLIDSAVAALKVLTIRAKDYFHIIEEIDLLELALRKAQGQNCHEVAKVNELVVSAKLTNCNFRSKLDEIRNELTIAKRELETTELENDASGSVEFWHLFQREVNKFILEQLPKYPATNLRLNFSTIYDNA